MVPDPQVHLAFRFHVNLYHSYRGDSLDERGIGKDLRIIRGILDELEALNAEGIPLRAAWDIENYYSLERYLPRHAPELIERIRARVIAGRDEVELMSWNNGLLTAHNGEELREALGRAIANPEGSGLADLFGSWAPIARPQECMFRTAQIPVYRSLGIEAVSLYYSAAPFNGFSSFIPLLPPAQRHNPLSLRDQASGASIRLLPAYSPADLIERWASLRLWLRELRRLQLREPEARDYLLLLDMDADDDFWPGFLRPPLSRLFPSFGGLGSLARSVADLPWLRFSLPGDYLRGHGDAGEVSFGQDLADGSFDGYSSWAEKAENAELWPRIAEARRTRLLADRLAGEGGLSGDPAFLEARQAAMGAILRALSTTHFGMASPVMNLERLRDAFSRAEEASSTAEAALALASSGRRGRARYYDERIDALPRGEGAIGLRDGEPWLLNPVASREALEGGSFAAPRRASSSRDLLVGPDSVRAGSLLLAPAPGGGLMLFQDGQPLFEAPLARPWIRYAGRVRGTRARGRREAGEAEEAGEAGEGRPRTRLIGSGEFGELRMEGEILLSAGRAARWSQVYTMAAGLGSLRVDVEIDYPETEPAGYDRGKAERLGRSWDGRWRETAPFELLPRLGAGVSRPARVWKQDLDEGLSSYALDYHRFGPNRDLDSLDNHCSDAWLALAGEGRGLLLAQAAGAQTLFAFCPLRVRLRGARQSVAMNPFGSYYGRQWRYPSAVTGLGRIAATAVGDNFDPYAPSWAGHRLRFGLMLAPYEGDCPPAALRRDALLFASSPREG